MGLTLMFFLNSILFGIGLAMDAFSVSLAAGMNEKQMTPARKLAVAGTFALFQTAMPLIGWLCVHTVADAFNAFRKYIPWIALVLLLFIGGKMLLEGIRAGDNAGTVDDPGSIDGNVDGNVDGIRASAAEVKAGRPLTLRTLMLMGLATSIDALSVGFTIAELPFPSALIESVIIGAVTLGICLAGLALGRLLGMKLAARASILGGLILIAIGLEIFITGIAGL
ncbi:MAG: manganese efflux pump [Clostridia bacterium]|nr:manganese efflux pump [Clostridia bacterium]